MPQLSAEQLVQGQLDAYNAHDLEGFLTFFSDDVRLYRPPATTPVLSGKTEFSHFYASERFNIPTLRAEVVKRMVAGNKVIDQELIFGLGDEPRQVMAVFEIKAGLIHSMWSFAADQEQG